MVGLPPRSQSATDTPLSQANRLSVTQLEQYLWSAADILRGSIDSSDYKTYIFVLLFLKRLSDRFEEEAEKLITEGMSETVAWTDPDEHQFFVPDRARWGAIQRQATNIGETLNKACAALIWPGSPSSTLFLGKSLLATLRSTSCWPDPCS